MKTVSFVEFRDKLIHNFNELAATSTHLFEVQLDKDVLWNLYLDSFPEGTNPIYRERRVHDCSCCRHFIKSIGNVVFIVDNKIKTIWDFDTTDTTYQTVIDALDKHVKQFAVTNVYFSDYSLIGTSKSYEHLENGDIKTWDHFYLILPNKYVKPKQSIPTIKGDYRSVKDVFKRSLEEISEDSVKTVLELINQGSLYRGNEWKAQLEKLLAYQNEYNAVADEDKNNWLWIKSIEAGVVVGKIKNHSIGTLLVDITEGTELDTAVRKYEQIVAPENYKRSTPIFTKKMLEDAKKKITELGYLDSLPRRFATLDDILINDVLFANRDVKQRITKTLDVFEEMAQETTVDPKKFGKVEEISIDNFLQNVLPTATSIEALVENRHSSNFVSLIAPQNKDAKSMFKWDNLFSWAYTGNIADSSMKENVKNAGGKVDGVLRFSIQWNDGAEFHNNDLDAHCFEPSGNHIYFGDKHNYRTGGELDVDIIYPTSGQAAVENITWPSKLKMTTGVYQFFVNVYNRRCPVRGFKAEVEFNGELYQFEYNGELRSSQNIKVVDVYFDGEKFSIQKEHLTSSASSKEVWGIKTNQFVPVTTICLSPNYWQDNKVKTGNLHYMFMLKDCVNPEEPNSWYNEYLDNELTPHRKVMEALGSKLAVASADDQLSGIGFSSTKRNELIVKVTGQTQRVVKIKF